jgi:hypothetical protein
MPPTSEERARLMRRVLKFRVEVAKLERQMAGALGRV